MTIIMHDSISRLSVYSMIISTAAKLA